MFRPNFLTRSIILFSETSLCASIYALRISCRPHIDVISLLHALHELHCTLPFPMGREAHAGLHSERIAILRVDTFHTAKINFAASLEKNEKCQKRPTRVSRIGENCWPAGAQPAGKLRPLPCPLAGGDRDRYSRVQQTRRAESGVGLLGRWLS